jgi:HAD superfamily hydrolase (TIGR01509 family)
MTTDVSTPTLDAFIFDFDGVLVDSNPLHVEAWRLALQQHGHEIATDRILKEMGKGGDKLVTSLLGEEIEHREGEALRAAHGREYARQVAVHGLRAFDGGRALILALRRRGVLTALATSSESEEVALAERATGIAWRDLFDAVVDAADVEETKPAPDLVAAAVDKLGMRPGRCAMLGDTPWDARAAVSAGTWAIGVTSGGNREETLRSAGASAIYRDAADVLAHLDQIAGTCRSGI